MATTSAVLDTNALLLPFTDGTDLQEELTGLVGAVELVVPSSVIRELEGLAKGGGATGQAARAATRLVARCRIEETDLPGDDGLLEVARRLGAVLVSNDRRMHEEARRSGLRVAAPRGHGRLHLL